MIPKAIHYCWFGKQKLPEEYKNYMESWRKYCPDFDIVEWNEDNFDVSSNIYCYEAYIAKKWAFVSDFARLKIIYENGGIYLDTDVEIIKPLDDLIQENKAWIGFQNKEQINTGLGFGAERHNHCIKQMLDIYKDRHFKKIDGNFDLTPCPVFNTIALKRYGLKTGKKYCNSIQYLPDMHIYPIYAFNPMDPDTLKLNVTGNTYSIHHYTASWISPHQKKIRKIKKVIPGFILRCHTNYKAQKDIRKLEKI